MTIDRLFLRFQLKLLLSLLASGALILLLIFPRVELQLARNIQSSLSAPLLLAAEALANGPAQPPGQNTAILRTQQRLGVPVTLLSRHDLPLPTHSLLRLDRGEVVAGPNRAPRVVLYVRIGNSDQVLRLGPLNPVHPMGEGRGLGMLALALCGLSTGVYLLVRPLRRRLAALCLATEAFGRGELSTRAAEDASDAVGRVGMAFNKMAHEIQRLIAAQQTLSQMVSHELRTPLQRLYFALERVRTATCVEQRQAALRQAERDMSDLNELIEELLTYVRLQSELPLRCNALDIQVLATHEIQAQSALADTIPIDLVVATREALPSVFANERLLRRAMRNLIENSWRHAASRVEVSLTGEAGQLRIDVEDDGPGVPFGERARIFEPFHRAEREPLRGPPGCGLGLAIVRRIVERHEGAIAVDDSRLGGARFRLSLPISRTPSARRC